VYATPLLRTAHCGDGGKKYRGSISLKKNQGDICYTQLIRASATMKNSSSQLGWHGMASNVLNQNQLNFDKVVDRERVLSSLVPY
jgi:hypothetical protein